MKRTRSCSAHLLLVVVSACGSDATDGPLGSGGYGANPGATGGAIAASGGTPSGSGGSVSTGGAGPSTGGAGGLSAGSGGTLPGSGGVPAGGSGGTAPETGGASTGSGGTTPGAGGAQAGGAGGGTSVGGLDPIIPEINGACPDIKEGTSRVTVMGLSATVIAGARKQGTGSLLIYYYGTGKLGGVSTLPAAIKTDVTSQGGIVFALNEAKNTGGDCSGTGTFGIDDFKVVDQFVACAVKNYGIDPKRIYATGCSAGGLTTGCMGIMRSNYIAAVAPNSGGITIGYGKLQDPKRVPNAITMNGGAADNVIVNFGQTSEAYNNYILKYGGFAVNCIHSSGHCGAPASVYASAWQFMKDHPYGTKPSPYANGLPSGFSPVCKVATMTSRVPLGGF